MTMSVSLKKSTTKTNIKHNNRTMNEKEKIRNSHIDYSRSHENRYLVQENIKELYKHEFDGVLEKYNAKQKRSDRKISNYYRHIDKSKKTSTQQEMILQIGDKDDFQNNAQRQMAVEILEKYFESFQERNPQLKIYNAVIHMDEVSPHMHLNFVPVATGYKRGLEKQVAFDKAIKQQDKTLNLERPFDDWRDKEVYVLEKMLKEHGIERKLVGTNEYKDVNEYKEKKDQLREIEKQIVLKTSELAQITLEKRKEINVLSSEYKAIEGEYGRLNSTLEKMTCEVEKEKRRVEIAKDLISDVRYGITTVEKFPAVEQKNILGRSTGIVEISLEDWLEVRKIAMATQVFKSENNALEGENERLKRNLRLRDKEYDKMSEENKGLKKTLKSLQDEIGTLKKFVQKAVQFLKDKGIVKEFEQELDKRETNKQEMDEKRRMEIQRRRQMGMER